ncbi:hypothetical protein Pint_29721 [Pistacia integerrima]|uniref:Uncharacterized protein n=1 Tax=Pistacia integerrima TaxID=434235 RepID=A0ACC0X4E7_9ROSI|nr:hypothetical protein Pint_29721 [Pistacia integerrima]
MASSLHSNLTFLLPTPKPKPIITQSSTVHHIPADLLAALRELLRQGECAVALHVFSAVRAEYPDRDLGLLADMISALGKKGMRDEIDRLIGELEEIDGGDEKGLVRVIKGVIGAGLKESTVRIYGVMKRSGVGSRLESRRICGGNLENSLV